MVTTKAGSPISITYPWSFDHDIMHKIKQLYNIYQPYCLWRLLVSQSQPTPLKVGEKTRINFFADFNDTSNSSIPFERIVRNIERHPHNQRSQKGVRAAYCKSVRMRGVVEGVRGEPWMQQKPPSEQTSAKYWALSFASLTEAFYVSLVDDPCNELLLLSVRKGLECRILHHRTPALIGKYLVNLHNRFHQGSSTSFVELIQMVPHVFW